jgi:hypothetical protein
MTLFSIASKDSRDRKREKLQELQEFRSCRIRERCCLKKNGTREPGVRIQGKSQRGQSTYPDKLYSEVKRNHMRQF